jgi:hypothetical protein
MSCRKCHWIILEEIAAGWRPKARAMHPYLPLIADRETSGVADQCDWEPLAWLIPHRLHLSLRKRAPTRARATNPPVWLLPTCCERGRKTQAETKGAL